MRIEPFVVEVPDAVLEDLRDRIRRTRWPDPAPGGPWAQGTDLEYLRGLLAYWADGFDWRRQERWLNRFNHRVADVDGVRIHFVHHRAADRGVPLVLTHGWPSTFVELLSLVDRLGDRFDLVVDRKSTRLNSSHGYTSYAVFCLKKKKKNLRYVSHRPLRQCSS